MVENPNLESVKRAPTPKVPTKSTRLAQSLRLPRTRTFPQLDSQDHKPQTRILSRRNSTIVASSPLNLRQSSNHHFRSDTNSSFEELSMVGSAEESMEVSALSEEKIKELQRKKESLIAAITSVVGPSEGTRQAKEIVEVSQFLVPYIVEAVKLGIFDEKFIDGLCEHLDEKFSNSKDTLQLESRYIEKIKTLFQRLKKQGILEKFNDHVRDYIDQIDNAQTWDERQALQDKLRLFVYNVFTPPYQGEYEGSCFATALLMNIWHNYPVKYMQVIRDIVDRDEVDFDTLYEKGPLNRKDAEKNFSGILGNILPNLQENINNSRDVWDGTKKPDDEIFTDSWSDSTECSDAEYDDSMTNTTSEAGDTVLENRHLFVGLKDILRNARKIDVSKFGKCRKRKFFWDSPRQKFLSAVANTLQSDAQNIPKKQVPIERKLFEKKLKKECRRHFIFFSKQKKLIKDLLDQGIVWNMGGWCLKVCLSSTRCAAEIIQKSIGKTRETNFNSDDGIKISRKAKRLAKRIAHFERYGGGNERKIFENMFGSQIYREEYVNIKRPIKKCKFSIEQFQPILEALEREEKGKFLVAAYNDKKSGHTFNLKAGKYNIKDMKIGEKVEIGHLNYQDSSDEDASIFMIKLDDNTIQLVDGNGYPISYEKIMRFYVYKGLQRTE